MNCANNFTMSWRDQTCELVSVDGIRVLISNSEHMKSYKYLTLVFFEYITQYKFYWWWLSCCKILFFA